MAIKTLIRTRIQDTYDRPLAWKMRAILQHYFT
jgi:hypothetical protein